jgi:hypothetical protein
MMQKVIRKVIKARRRPTPTTIPATGPGWSPLLVLGRALSVEEVEVLVENEDEDSEAAVVLCMRVSEPTPRVGLIETVRKGEMDMVELVVYVVVNTVPCGYTRFVVKYCTTNPVITLFDAIT